MNSNEDLYTLGAASPQHGVSLCNSSPSNTSLAKIRDSGFEKQSEVEKHCDKILNDINTQNMTQLEDTNQKLLTREVRA